MSKRTKLYPFAVGTRLTSETHAALCALATAKRLTISQWLRELVIERLVAEETTEVRSKKK